MIIADRVGAIRIASIAPVRSEPSYATGVYTAHSYPSLTDR